MILIPDSWGSPLLEENTCHAPAGSPKGGQFCSKPGGPQGARRLPVIAHEVKDLENFSIEDIRTDAERRRGVLPDGGVFRRFFFDPVTGRLLLGTADPMAAVRNTHATELLAMEERGVTRGVDFDDWMRGYVAFTQDMPDGTVVLWPGLTAERMMRPDRSVEAVTDRILKTVEFFGSHGATAKTELSGARISAKQPWESTFGSLYPAMVKPRRMKKAA